MSLVGLLKQSVVTTPRKDERVEAARRICAYHNGIDLEHMTLRDTAACLAQRHDSSKTDPSKSG